MDEIFEDLDKSSIKLRSIFKVNVWLCESNSDTYTPKMGLDVKSCISELQKLKEEALKCYNDIEELGNDSQFCQMLLLDGCFVVEFIRERCHMCPQGENKIININDNYIFRDLMLLENQLPFFVLNQLHDMTKQDDELPLAILANNLFTFFVDLPKMTPESFRKTKCNEENIKTFTSSKLSEAGVSFAKIGNINRNKDNIRDMTSLFDIKFENGLMTIPCFQVCDDTETFLRNLIAYEQQSSDVQPKHFSDYATFMDYLIDSDKDVNLLRRKGIIENWIGEDKEVASLFNKIGNGVTVYSTFYYNEECIKAIQHCEQPWNRMKANLRHNYFNSPWAGASTVAAIILLLLTATQTVLAFTGARSESERVLSVATLNRLPFQVEDHKAKAFSAQAQEDSVFYMKQLRLPSTLKYSGSGGHANIHKWDYVENPTSFMTTATACLL
ncbi:hypothetical protein H5410_019914 [Solanum commersonii]|uniref:Uncharacterized protein n=1 Tax=Solanum commersonii TaxID=4109 RepID=A0A9J5Z6Y4_SOLCO|nr:hypothetical protein H5410_019914 [Solanum commersonii]